MNELTTKAVVQAISDIEGNQVVINQACAEAFTGRNVKAPKDSCLHKALLELIKIRDAFNVAHKAANDIVRENAKLNGMKATGIVKYNGLNILSTEVTRWINKVNRTEKYNGLRASIKATGGRAKYSIALVQSSKAFPEQSAASKKTSTSKAKQLTNLMNDSSISLDEAIKALVDTYTFKCVNKAVAKFDNALNAKGGILKVA